MNNWKKCETPEAVQDWIDKAFRNAAIHFPPGTYKAWSAFEVRAILEEARTKIFDEMLDRVYAK
jgi:hypothetical protein